MAKSKAAAVIEKKEVMVREENRPSGTSFVFSIADRLLLGGILPDQGDMMTMLLTRDIGKKIEVGLQEMELIGLVQEGNGFRWDEKKESPLEIIFSEAEMRVLKDSVDRLDRDKKINRHNVDICLRIRG